MHRWMSVAYLHGWVTLFLFYEKVFWCGIIILVLLQNKFMEEIDTKLAKRRRIYAWVFGGVFCLIAFGVVVYLYTHKLFWWQKKGLNFKIPITAINPTNLPSKFPSDLPLLPSSAVIHNFESVLENGTKQSVRKWKSYELPLEVKGAFTKYFTLNGWEITTDVEEPQLWLIGANKGDLFMSVSIHALEGAQKGSLIEVVVK